MNHNIKHKDLITEKLISVLNKKYKIIDGNQKSDFKKIKVSYFDY